MGGEHWRTALRLGRTVGDWPCVEARSEGSSVFEGSEVMADAECWGE